MRSGNTRHNGSLGPSAENGQPVGQAVLVYGKVCAQSPDGALRTLQPNSLVFENDSITTGSNGMVSISFIGSKGNQLDLGRMADVLLSRDTIPSEDHFLASDMAADPSQLQQIFALTPPAAGPESEVTILATATPAGITSTDQALTEEEAIPSTALDDFPPSSDTNDQFATPIDNTEKSFLTVHELEALLEESPAANQSLDSHHVAFSEQDGESGGLPFSQDETIAHPDTSSSTPGTIDAVIDASLPGKVVPSVPNAELEENSAQSASGDLEDDLDALIPPPDPV